MVFIIRNPFDVLLAEWNRQQGNKSHTGVAPESSFGEKYYCKMVDVYERCSGCSISGRSGVWKGGFHAHVHSSNHVPLLMHMRIDAMKAAAAVLTASITAEKL